MKYIADVFKIKECKQTMYRNSSAYALMMLTNIFILVICIVFLPVFNMLFHLGFKGVVILALILCGLLDVTIARIMIYRELERKYERKHNLNNNIIKYLRINEGSEETRETPLYKVKYSLFEHYNGVPFFFFQLRFGSHKQKPVSNREFLEKLTRIFTKHKLVIVKTTELEDFTDNELWEYTLARLQHIESNRFRVFYLHILEYLNKKYNKIKVPTIYYKIILRTPEQKFRCSDIVDEIYKLYKTEYHNFRDLKFIDYKGLSKYITEYFQVETLDVTYSESLENNKLKVGSSELIAVTDYRGDEVFNQPLVEQKNRKIRRTIKRETKKSKDKMINIK